MFFLVGNKRRILEEYFIPPERMKVEAEEFKRVNLISFEKVFFIID